MRCCGASRRVSGRTRATIRSPRSSTLLIFNLGWIDFGARPLNSALALARRARHADRLLAPDRQLPIDLRSPLITGLSLSLLLRADEPWIHALAGVIAIGSKFVLRIDGKHIWNPAGFAIVVLLFTAKSHVWISPGQLGLDGLVRRAARASSRSWCSAPRAAPTSRSSSSARHAALLFARAVWLGDPLAIPLHQLQSGSLLIFTFFMISDPRTSPDSRLGRFIFASSVALLAHYMAFFMQMRPALYVALIALSPFILLIDRILPAQRFAWNRPAPQGASAMTKSSRLKSTVAVAAIVAQLVAQTGPAAAFCGFYVAKADSKLFNKSSKVVLTRDGETTAITMASDYEGEPKEFARRHPGADLHRAQADRRGRDEDHRPSRRLHGAAAGRVSRRGSVRAADAGGDARSRRRRHAGGAAGGCR